MAELCRACGNRFGRHASGAGFVINNACPAPTGYRLDSVFTPSGLDIPDNYAVSYGSNNTTPQEETIVPLTVEAPDASNDIIAPKRADCKCESCKLARFEDSKIRDAVVHAYSYRPRGGWRPKSVPNDPVGYHLGVELETDNYSGGERYSRSNVSVVSNAQAVSMKRPASLWLAKHDGSITGPEFVSMPATLTYWRKHKKALAEMFTMLVHAGYRSHDNDNCGMHINISKTAFGDSRHLFRFLSLIHHTPAWSLKMSQRTASSAQQWASMNVLANDSTRMAEAESQFTMYPRSSGKYQAVNCMARQGRFEFRLPRGTLRIDRFFKNLEWTQAMIEYSREASVSAMNPLAFMAWAVEHKDDYPYLVKFLVEKRLVASGTEVTVDGTTVRAKRQYNRRPGSNPPGRPAGYSPRRRTQAASVETYSPPVNDPSQWEQGQFSMSGDNYCGSTQPTGGQWTCERVHGHTGPHGAFFRTEYHQTEVWS
jgi:hypothetical protein